MKRKLEKKILAAAVGAGLAGAIAVSGVAQANPFAVKDLGTGYMVADAHGAKKAQDGKCGGQKEKDAKCGGAKPADAKAKDGKCGGAKPAKSKEGKCGEGKCGSKAK